MEAYDIKRLGLILAVQAEIESMKVANIIRTYNNESIAYSEEHFLDKAEELRNLAHCHAHQL